MHLCSVVNVAILFHCTNGGFYVFLDAFAFSGMMHSKQWPDCQQAYLKNGGERWVVLYVCGTYCLWVSQER